MYETSQQENYIQYYTYNNYYSTNLSGQYFMALIIAKKVLSRQKININDCRLNDSYI